MRRLSILVSFAMAAVVAVAASRGEAADSLAAGAKAYKPSALERIGLALAGARELQAAVKAGDAKAAQAAWIKSRKGWEAAEPITGEFFGELDEAIDAWPDAKQGYHAIEAPLFAGKLDEVKAPTDKLVADLAEFHRRLGAANPPMPARRFSICRRTSRVSRRSTSWPSRARSRHVTPSLPTRSTAKSKRSNGWSKSRTSNSSISRPCARQPRNLRSSCRTRRPSSG